MVAGRPPFVGDNAVGIVSQHLNAQPVPPSLSNPEASHEFDAIVLRLLAKSPADRPRAPRPGAPSEVDSRIGNFGDFDLG